jgi:hypothetical protein
MALKYLLLPAQRFLMLQQTNTVQVLKKFKYVQKMQTGAVVSVPFQPTRWRGLKLVKFRPPRAHVLLQHVGRVLLQPALHVVTALHVLEAVTVVVVPVMLPATEEQAQVLLQQEEHQLSEQTLELATDGKETQSEALRLVMFTMQGAPLHVRLSLDVPLEHVAHVGMGHALRAWTPVTARLAVILTHLCQVVHSLKFYITSWATA